MVSGNISQWTQKVLPRDIDPISIYHATETHDFVRIEHSRIQWLHSLVVFIPSATQRYAIVEAQ
jgi:hypothetical protein